MGRLFLGTDVEKMGLTWITLCARYLLALSKISIPYRLRGIFRTLISSSPPAFFSPGCVEGALLFDAKIEADLPSPSSNTRRILDGYLDFCFFARISYTKQVMLDDINAAEWRLYSSVPPMIS